MNVLIVEDEPLVARRLSQFTRRLLASSLARLDVVDTFEAAEGLIATVAIDVLLLDLNLGGKDGFHLLDAAGAGAFHTIIVSANPDFALEAFARGVIDYVAKPFTEERLGAALRRAAGPATRSLHAARYLGVRKHGRIDLVDVDEVRYLRASGNFSELVLASGRREFHNKSLDRLQALLPADFERIHRSYLVRLSAARTLHAREGSCYELEMCTGEFLPVGRTRAAAVRARLG